jgi:hypothetical protein
MFCFLKNRADFVKFGALLVGMPAYATTELELAPPDQSVDGEVEDFLKERKVAIAVEVARQWIRTHETFDEERRSGFESLQVPIIRGLLVNIDLTKSMREAIAISANAADATNSEISELERERAALAGEYRDVDEVGFLRGDPVEIVQFCINRRLRYINNEVPRLQAFFQNQNAAIDNYNRQLQRCMGMSRKLSPILMALQNVLTHQTQPAVDGVPAPIGEELLRDLSALFEAGFQPLEELPEP